MADITYKYKKYDSSKIDDDRIVIIYDEYPNKSYNISIYKFVELLNSVECTKNSLDICNFIGCNNQELRNLSLRYSTSYWSIFKGQTTNESSKKILDFIKCDVKPKQDSKTYKAIMFIKWKILEYKKKQVFDNYTGEWIGVYTGLVLYFDELDEINFKNTNYVKNMFKPILTSEI